MAIFVTIASSVNREIRKGGKIMPTRKVTAGALAGALSVVVVWGLKQFAHTDIPGEVASALTTILSLFTSYAVAEPE